jgi:HSP20 family molecular chaperone IbpA
MSNTTLLTVSSRDQAWTHKTLHKRWDDIFRVGSRISLIERWPDDNYTPQPIPIQQYDTGREFVITAHLNGFKSTDVHVDIYRGALIILAVPDSIGSEGEHYCEVPLPPNINQRLAEVVFSDGMLTVSFRKPRWMVAALKVALAQLHL